ncbi:MAG: ECF transporter S component [Mogibacterium sp.]|nr:ECF transporter S component [Mogibacterium sp.]
MKNNNFSTNTLVKLALMTALSLVLLMLVRIPFPPAPFLVYDPADIPIYITTFAFGPAAGLIVTFVVCIIQAFALGGDGLYGFLMHFVATGAFAVIAGLIYQRNKTRKTAAVSVVTGVIIATIVMIGMNLIVTPLYMGVPREAVAAMIIPTILPFNLLKAGINGALTFVLYKRISRFLHNEGRVEKKTVA